MMRSKKSVSIIERITKEALLESYNNLNQAKLAKVDWDNFENTIISPTQTRLLIDLNDRPIKFETIKNRDPELRMTTGLYSIALARPGLKRYNKKYKFIIRTDLVGFSLKTSGPKHFRAMAEKIPEIAWMIRNTNYDDELFGIAVKHKGVQIPFSLNCVEYKKKLDKQDSTVSNTFVTRICTQDDYINKYGYKVTYGYRKISLDQKKIMEDTINQVEEEEDYE